MLRRDEKPVPTAKILSILIIFAASLKVCASNLQSLRFVDRNWHKKPVAIILIMIIIIIRIIIRMVIRMGGISMKLESKTVEFKREFTDDLKYAGSGVGSYGDIHASDGWHFKPYAITVDLPPLATVVFKKVSD